MRTKKFVLHLLDKELIGDFRRGALQICFVVRSAGYSVRKELTLREGQ